MAEAVLFVTKNGYGKVVEDPREVFPPKNRGGQGVTGFNVTDDTGPIVCTEHVQTGAGENVLLTTAQGRCLMIRVDDLTPRSRTAGGVRLMNVADGDEIVCVLV